MRPDSVASIKGRKRQQSLPKEGTATRRVYDLFMNNKGKIINGTIQDIIGCNDKRSIFTRLIDSYNLDIRRVGRKKYCLVGEWSGDRYIDYLAEGKETK